MSEPTRLTVAGYKQDAFFVKAANVAASLEHLFPSRVKVAIVELPSKEAWKKWLPDVRARIGARSHRTSPITWTGTSGDETYLGGCDDMLAWARENFVGTPGAKRIKVQGASEDGGEEKGEASYDYDLIVIGGGSGGLSCSKEAKKLGARVCVLDYVKPSPQGTSWDIGGTCVNVGCIPKKLMHTAAILGESLKHDANDYGWDLEGGAAATHNWARMVENVQGHIQGLNWGYKVDLRDKEVEYKNKLGTFVDAHTIALSDPVKGGASEQITGRKIVVAVGGRPKPLSCPGAEHAIDSDDIFSMEKPPGKILMVGAAYIALECAGFLTALGFDVTVMVRSILLRGFDRECSEAIGKHMEETGTKFMYGKTPKSIEKLADGRLKVLWDGGEDVFDTVFAAIGRTADTAGLGLDAVGVETDARSKKIVCRNEQSSVSNIFAIGDVVHGELELTPVAIQAGKLLARRLFGGSDVGMNYQSICTTVFTPLEYGCCGLSEEDAEKEFGKDSIEVFHQKFTPLEWTVPDERPENKCFMKLICSKNEDNRVVGFHYLGPNAGEVTQGVGVAIKMGATYDHFVDTVGIHPTNAEVFTTLSVTKSSGEAAEADGC